MRYAAAAVFFAGAAMAGTEAPESTIYSTDFVTITSCAPEVTNCPARTHSTVYPVTSSTVYSTNVYATTSAGTVVYSTESISVSATLVPVVSTGKSYYNTTAPANGPTAVLGVAVSSGSSPVAVPTTVTSAAAVGTTPAAAAGTTEVGAVGTTEVAAVGTNGACASYSVKTISTSVTTVIPTVIYETVSVACPTAAATTVGTVGTVGVATGTAKSSVPSSSVVTAGAGNVAFSGVLAAAAGLVAVFLA